MLIGMGNYQQSNPIGKAHKNMSVSQNDRKRNYAINLTLHICFVTQSIIAKHVACYRFIKQNI
jgi:hypothetical protein